MSEQYDTSTDQVDMQRNRSGKASDVAHMAGAIVIGAIICLALLRAGFKGRVGG